MANNPIYQKVAVTDAGDIIPGAEYTVTDERTGTPLTIYSSRTGAAKSAPYFADANGVIQFWAAPGSLARIEATGPSGTYTDRYVEFIMLTESETDTTAGRALKVGDFGLGIGGTSVVDFDTQVIPQTIYVSTGSTSGPPGKVAGGMLTVTRAGGGSVQQRLQNTDDEIFVRNSNSAVTIWSNWVEVFTTSSLNPLEFGGTGAFKTVAIGYARSATALRFYLPIQLLTDPVSLTTVSTFSVNDTNFSVVASGLSGFAVGGGSSNRLVEIEVAGLSGLTAGAAYYIRTETSSSKITVNP